MWPSARRIAAALLFLTLRPSACLSREPLDVVLPEGFRAELFADDDLASDIYSMTVDSQGRVVVSGAGYVRTLIDRDGDGRADEARQFADGPLSGAQGMFFDGPDLICTGDAGLLRYRDRNADSRADGPPELLLKIKTGAEHHAHAVRRGPDGWWYLIAGNMAGVSQQDVNSTLSPVQNPHAGVVMRISPDFSTREVVAHGYRNAYDFDFHQQGDLFVYDSDGERDVSLPWYRPTRVFAALPGTHAGWFSRSWKRPDHFFDMPPALAHFGRGSPTGVVCYRHDRFPPPYRNALFALDWTFGRVMALPPGEDGSVWKSAPVRFMTGAGHFGFAPTDAAVGPDGALYVSVGGRGTRGGVYRITYQQELPPKKSPRTKLAACLDAPQPLSSWSRAKWAPVARELGADAFGQAALDRQLNPAQRVRAVEILVELFGGLDNRVLATLSADAQPQVRARAAWSLGRCPADGAEQVLSLYLHDEHPQVLRWALQAVPRLKSDFDDGPLVARVGQLLGHPDRFVRQAAVLAVASGRSRAADAVGQHVPTDLRARLALATARVIHDPRLDLAAVNTALDALESNEPDDTMLDATRLMQLALGDVGPRAGKLAVFDGYHGGRPDVPQEIADRLVRVYPTGRPLVDHELGRLLALLGPASQTTLDHVLATVQEDSHPVADIHQLIVAASLRVAPTARTRAIIADALLRLEPKTTKRELQQDQNWEVRIRELFSRLTTDDPELAAALVAHDHFGHPSHVLFLDAAHKILERDQFERALDRIVARRNPPATYEWTPDLIRLLDKSDRHLELIRAQANNLAVRDAVLLALARRGQVRDRRWMVEGLDSGQLEVIDACVQALARLPPLNATPSERVALLRTARRLGEDRRQYAVRERLMRQLMAATGKDLGFQFGESGHQPQREALNRWTAYLRNRYPQFTQTQLPDDSAAVDQLQKDVLDKVDWTAGDAQRGKTVFAARSCASCHGNRRALGPSLAGVAKRFNRRDLFAAILFPTRDVPLRYRTTVVQTHDGLTYSGVVIYRSVDGITLRNAVNETIRLEAAEIEEVRSIDASLMPAGLLSGLSAGELADLYAYMKTL